LSIPIAQRPDLKGIDPPLDLADAKLAGPSIPEQCLSRVGNGAA
jgi:hypothetical protein